MSTSEMEDCAWSVPAADLDAILKESHEAFAMLRGARIFLTGGTGFIGKWLLESLRFANYHQAADMKVVVLTRDPRRFTMEAPYVAQDPAITLWQGDVRTFAEPPGTFTHVIHGAVDTGSAASAIETFDVLVNGTTRVLEFCSLKRIPELLLISSGAVYGRQPATVERIQENYSGAPLTSFVDAGYGEGKRASEWLTAAHANRGGPGTRIARCFALVGPHLPLDGRFAAGNFLRDALRRQAITVNGDGTALRSYLYATDLVTWLWAILVRGAPGEAYNVGSEDAVSIADLARRIAYMGTTPLAVTVKQKPDPERAPERYVPSTAKARELLGLHASVPLDKALARTFAWLKARPQVAALGCAHHGG